MHVYFGVFGNAHFCFYGRHSQDNADTILVTGIHCRMLHSLEYVFSLYHSLVLHFNCGAVERETKSTFVQVP